jgi:predicted TIM-barrel fold metal-dependent hydrolase
VFGTDFGPVPYGIKEHVQIVEEVLPNLADRERVFWKTSNRIFRLGLFDTGFITPAIPPVAA